MRASRGLPMRLCAILLFLVSLSTLRAEHSLRSSQELEEVFTKEEQREVPPGIFSYSALLFGGGSIIVLSSWLFWAFLAVAVGFACWALAFSLEYKQAKRHSGTGSFGPNLSGLGLALLLSTALLWALLLGIGWVIVGAGLLYTLTGVGILLLMFLIVLLFPKP